jgi:hypothetical protein
LEHFKAFFIDKFAEKQAAALNEAYSKVIEYFQS